MEKERIKHTRSTRVIYKNNHNTASITEFEYARSKDEFKNERTRKLLAMIHGASKESYKYFKKNNFIVLLETYLMESNMEIKVVRSIKMELEIQKN